MDKKKLKELIKDDKKIYSSNIKINKIYDFIVRRNNRYFYKNIYYSRMYNFYLEKRNSILGKIEFIYYSRKNNLLGRRNNLELYGKFGKCLKIYHSNIVINKKAVLGDNVVLHGNNCIGNKNDENEAPIIGDNVDIGYGAIIIGNIRIANNIKIGANATVTKSFLEEGITIVGSPAKKIK